VLYEIYQEGSAGGIVAGFLDGHSEIVDDPNRLGEFLQ